MHALLLLNATIGIVEFASGLRFTPLVAAGVVIEDDWRSTALLGHPLANASLTGAYILMLALGAGRDLPPLLRPDTSAVGAVVQSGLLNPMTAAAVLVGFGALLRHLRQAAAVVGLVGTVTLAGTVVLLDQVGTHPASSSLVLLPFLLALPVVALEQLLAADNASEDSLIGFLRRHKPDWPASIGKLVDPETLLRTDLSPMLGHGDDLYGVAIDLEKLKAGRFSSCLLYTSDAADERSSVDLGGRRIIKKKNR